MELMKVVVTPLNKKQGSQVAALVFAALRLENGGCINLRNIRIIDTPKGHFVSYAAQKRNNGQYEDYFFLDYDNRKIFEEKILNTYSDVRSKAQTGHATGE